MAGRYRVLKPLGKGGQGSVWRAVHLRTEQPWAIKAIEKKQDGGGFRELNAMKKLHHPNLPRVLDVLEDEAYLYLVMEYVGGHDLEEIIRNQGHLGPRQVLDVGIQIGGALTYLHERAKAVWHLDLKPANIICRRDGRMILVDFGSAWTETGQEERRRYGTEGFAAPEQFDLTEKVDGRTDVYGLGATLYYLISGKQYSLSLKKAKIPGCPEKLGEIIKKCLCQEKEQRYETSRKLQKELIQLKRSYDFEGQRKKALGALLMLILSLGLAVRELPKEFAFYVEQDWDYERLLQEALCVSREESLDYYRRAVFMDPCRRESYLQYLEQADQDGVFTKEEETFFRLLLHTIPLGQSKSYEELLSEHPEEYGAVAARMGVICWYDLEGDQGRQVGTGWFRKAEEAGKMVEGEERIEPWTAQAEIFSHLGSYYERFANGEKRDEQETLAKEYWENLTRLTEEELLTGETVWIQLRFLKESRNQLLFLTEDLWNIGISKQELRNRRNWILDQAEMLAGREEGTKFGQKILEEICQLGKTAEEVEQNLEKGERRETQEQRNEITAGNSPEGQKGAGL